MRRRLGQPEPAADLAQDAFMPPQLSTIAQGSLVNHRQGRDLEAVHLEALAVQPHAFHPSVEKRAATLKLPLAFDRRLQGLAELPLLAFLLAHAPEYGWV
ncbi:hypothetical protein [Roseateles sp.]|uniref:hypothetical protein n=1 Tax=Roseateles sp. TaxID=1971397 RepID=UPI00286B2D59|nr:hypothetical protein [Roseateles sp.]